MSLAQLAVRGSVGGVHLHEVDDVVAGALQFIRDHVADAALARLLSDAVHGLDSQIKDDKAMLPFIHLPLAIYGAIRGNPAPARDLAVITTLLFLGIDILDDIQDDDLPDHWAGHRPAEIHMAAATFLASLPQLGISKLPILPLAKVRMMACLSEGLLKMSGGQLNDLRMAGADCVSPEAVEASVVSKSGAECAAIAMLAAHMAGVSEETAKRYGELGSALGTAGQIASDCHDIFQSSHSKDLANGTRCLPVAVYLSRLDGSDRTAFLHLLDEARESPAACELIRRDLRAKGVLRFCAFIVEVYCQRARDILAGLGLSDADRVPLERMIAYVSFFSTQEAV